MFSRRVAVFSIWLPLALTGCGSWTPTALTIQNQSKRPLTDLVVNFAGVRHRFDRTLMPGQSTLIWNSSGREGSLCVNFLHGEKRSEHGLSYMSANMPVHCRLRVTDNGLWRSCSAAIGPLVDMSKEARLDTLPADVESCR